MCLWMCINLQNMSETALFSGKFTQLTKILHDRRSLRSRQIPTLGKESIINNLLLLIHLSGNSLQLDGWVVIFREHHSHQSPPYLPGFVPNSPVSPYICHIQLANTQKHKMRTTSIQSELVSFSAQFSPTILYFNRSLNWRALNEYSDPASKVDHLFCPQTSFDSFGRIFTYQHKFKILKSAYSWFLN